MEAKVLQDTEMKYGAAKAEIFAVITFVEKYRTLLGSAPFKLRVNNCALARLKKYSMDQSYIGRWIVRLDGYHMIIEHRTRDKHQNAESLSCNASLANLFNDYFCSVYKPAVTQRLGSATDTRTHKYTLNNNNNNNNNNICLGNLTISVDGIENLLQSCDDSSAHGCLHSSCVTVLVSYLLLCTTWSKRGLS